MDSAIPRKKAREAIDRIRVAVRCRPLIGNESALCEVACTRKNQIGVIPKHDQRYRNKLYDFDIVYDTTVTQEHLFEQGIQPIIADVLSGYNCTVFAYGQTGTGKTFTMEGNRFLPRRARSALPSAARTHETDGIIPRAIISIFSKLSEAKVDYAVTVSHLEIYNEELSDLLSEEEGGKRLTIYHDTSVQGRGVFVQGLEELVVRCPKDIIDILKKSMLKRSVASTNLNDRSSRSHCIFSIMIHMKETTEKGEQVVKTGTLNLVDLAGSESIGRSGAVDTRAKEAGHINTSLLALGRCISALVERRGHVPYRESKLTRLLQESLGGRNKTLLIATVSPSSPLEMTLSTLDYALRAKSIQNKPQVNVTMSQKTYVKELQTQISALRRQIGALRAEKGVILPQDQFDEMESTISTQNVRLENLNAILETKTKQLEDIHALFDETRAELDDITTKKENIESELNQTVCELSEKKVELDSHKFALGVYDEVDGTMRKEAVEVRNVLEEALTHKVLLFDKVESQVKLEKRNVDRVEQRAAGLSGVVDGIQIQFRKFHSTHLSQMTTATKRIEGLHQSYVSLKEEHSKLSQLYGNLGERVQHSTDRNVSMMGELQRQNETASGACLAFGQTAQRELQTFQENVRATLDEQRNVLGCLNREISGLSDLIQNKSIEHEQELRSFCNALCGTVVSFVSDLNQRHDVEMNEMRNFKEEYERNAAQIAELQQQQMRLMNNRFSTFTQFDHNRRQTCDATLSNLQSSCQDALTKMNESSSTSTHQFNSHLQTMSHNTRTLHDTHVDSFGNAIQSFSDDMRRSVTDFTQKQMTKCNDEISRLNQSRNTLESNSDGIIEMTNAIASKSQSLWSTIHENNVSLLNENGSMSRFGESFHKFSTGHNRQLEALRDQCSETSFDSYEPRGITPIRRPVRYPKRFCDRPVLQDVLSEFREKRIAEAEFEEDVEMTDVCENGESEKGTVCEEDGEHDDRVCVSFEDESLGLKICAGANNMNAFVRHCENGSVADGAHIVEVDGCDVTDKSMSYVRTLLSSKQRPIVVTFCNPQEEIDQENVQLHGNV